MVRKIMAGLLLLAAASGCEPPEDRSAEKPGVPPDASEGQRPPPGTGTVTGALSYPSDYLPEDLKVCAQPVPSGPITCESERQGDRYTLALSPGRYRVWAETADFPGVRAYYSQAVRCGLSVDCTDHSPVVVEVAANATVRGVDPGDWYDNN